MDDLIIGVTATRNGATVAQQRRLLSILSQWRPHQFHHGDCLGGDTDAHNIYRIAVPGGSIVCHPPINPELRAFNECDEYHAPYEYLQRNKHIVMAVHHLVAIPDGFEETQRSGTWSTVRYARTTKTPHTIIFPDGTIFQWEP